MSSIENLSKVESTTLQDQVYEKLKMALISGQFTPGEVLTIRNLAEAFGTSAMPVRGAMFRLVSERALEMAGARSMRVPLSSQERFEDVATVRKLLEGAAAFQAAKRVTKAEIEVISDLNEKMRKAVASSRITDAVEANRAFHFSIYELAGSETLLRAIEPLWLQHGVYFPVIVAANIDKKPANERFAKNHDDLMRCLSSNDSRGAKKAIEADIDDSIYWYREHCSTAELSET